MIIQTVEVLIHLDLRISQAIHVRLELLWQINELSQHLLVSHDLSLEELRVRDLSTLRDCLDNGGIFSDFGQSSHNDSLFNEFATKFKIVLASLLSKLINKSFR